MRTTLSDPRRLLFLIAASLAASVLVAVLGVSVTPTPAVAQWEDESSPAVFWRLERQRQSVRRKPPVVIQRPTRMTRGVAPRRGFAKEVPADSAAAVAAASASTPMPDTPSATAGVAAPVANSGPDATVQPTAPAGPPFVIAIFGDNVAQMLAQGVTDAYAEHNVTVLRRARENTGLVRDDYYDWPKTIQEFLASDQKIDLAVMMLGSNDRQPIREGGQTADILSDKWKDTYRARATAIAEAFRNKGVPLIWVGMTVMKNERLSADIAQFNEIYREAVQKTGATYVDVWEPFVDERNRFTLSGPDLNGHVTRIRTGDGVHFTRAGARKLAYFLEADVKRRLDLRSPGALAPAIADAPGAPQNASFDARPQPETSSPGGMPVPVPAPEPVAPVRPLAGRVAPLTASALSPGGELATVPLRGDGNLLDSPPPESRAGRADDFRWPRR
ncbi:MAG: SGNH family hydrolase [Beijerinckiaceae bacterium]|nr:SGNH family hydrolase [Beijerinckiaceae bacterium]